MYHVTQNKTTGFIAITSVIILSVILLLLASTLSLSTYLNSAGALDAENKEISYFLAYSCLDRALLNLAQNPLYAGNETVMIDANQCAIGPIALLGANRVIPASATYNNTITNLNTTVDPLLNFVSFKEQ